MEFQPIASSSAGCAYLVSSKGTTPLLVDAGAAFAEIQKATGHRVSQLSGVLLSHAHGDHIKSAAQVIGCGVNGYASKETWAGMAKAPNAKPIPTHRARVLEAGKQVSIYGWTVLPFEAVHDVPGTLGFVIADQHGGKLLYLTDSAYSKYRFEGLTHIAVECNWSEELLRQNTERGVVDPTRFVRTVRTHMSLERLIEMLKANDLSKVQEIHLLHLSDANSDEEMFRQEVQRATGCPTYVAAKKGGAR